MFGRNSVRLQASLYERAVQAAAKAGYSSVEELVTNAVEKELERLETGRGLSPDLKAEVEKRLRGLGYIE